VIGDSIQNVGLPVSGLLDWIDRTFPPEDERSFVAPVRDIELLVRIGWNAPLPERIDDEAILNVEDLPDEIADGLAHPTGTIVQCSACRRLCVRDEFVWKDRQLCAWDYHGQQFGKRGPWRHGPYEERHFDTLLSCAYVAPPLLAELGVEIVAVLNGIEESAARRAINLLLESDPEHSYLAVRTQDGLRLLRET
jgi:hypothetical protein